MIINFTFSLQTSNFLHLYARNSCYISHRKNLFQVIKNKIEKVDIFVAICINTKIKNLLLLIFQEFDPELKKKSKTGAELLSKPYFGLVLLFHFIVRSRSVDYY